MNNKPARIYLDYNATTPLLAEVKQAMLELPNIAYNPSSMHYHGREARKIIDSCREAIYQQLKVPKDYRVIFTASGSEANNLLFSGVSFSDVIITSIEHDSVLRPVEIYSENFHLVDCDKNGVIKLASLAGVLAKLKGKKFLASMMLANNETGVIQPVSEAARMVHEAGGFIHSDLVQAVGKIPVDFTALGLDAATISAHKFYGPVGAAALVYNPALTLEPQILGGGQQFGKRAGTENVMAISGFNQVVLSLANILQKMNKLRELRDYLEEEVRRAAPRVEVFGQAAERLPNTSNLTMPGVDSQVQLAHFDLAGISVSTGAACSSGKLSSSRILAVMGVDEEIAKAAIRVSLGVNTTKEEIDYFLASWAKLYNKCKTLAQAV